MMVLCIGVHTHTHTHTHTNVSAHTQTHAHTRRAAQCYANDALFYHRPDDDEWRRLTTTTPPPLVLLLSVFGRVGRMSGRLDLGRACGQIAGAVKCYCNDDYDYYFILLYYIIETFFLSSLAIAVAAHGRLVRNRFLIIVIIARWSVRAA